jgi:hypothetical protein
LRYRTDFNNVRKGRRLTALLGFGGSLEPPQRGARINLFDGDGNSCFAVAERYENDVIVARPDWSTWKPAVHVTERPVVDLMEALRASVRSAAANRENMHVKRGEEAQRVTAADDAAILEIKQSA